MARGLLAFAILACLVHSIRADESSPLDDRRPRAQDAAPDAADKAFNSRVLELCRSDTKAYRFTISDAPGKQLVPHEVMTWTNPVRDAQLGVVHCWTDEGRVRAVSSVFNGPVERGDVQIMHEFASLATTRIQARRDGTTHWEVSKPGAVFQAIENAPVPDETRAGRLRQIRALAREFSAGSASPYADKGRWELRMLPQPLYRQEAAKEGVAIGESLDGALFAFVSDAGTDPELLLVIEARRKPEADTESGAWRWNFAAARFSDNSLFLKRYDVTLWEFVNRDGIPDYAAGPADIYRLRRDRLMPASELGAPTRQSTR